MITSLKHILIKRVGIYHTADGRQGCILNNQHICRQIGLMKANTCCLLLFLSLAFGARAATFSVTPNVVSNDYTGLLTFHMTGLSPGETVQLVQYYDLNGNGVVDASDLAVRGEIVTDGQAKLVDGATNINVFRDEDGLTNGAITASFCLALAPVAGAGVGHYLFQCSSPSNHFASTNLQFTVANAPYAQIVQGTVTNNSTNVPYAVVGLIQNQNINGAAINFIVGGSADANGHYSLKAPVGTFLAVAFQRGYVGNLLSFPAVVLTSNATVTANIPLIAATTTIAGSLLDSANLANHVVPYAEVAFLTHDGLAAVALCDSNGNFTVPVVPDVWYADVLEQSAASQSYMTPDVSLNYDTRTNPVSNATIILKHAMALINGRVVDTHGQPVAGASLFANADFGQYDSYALSDSNGFYSFAIDAGQGIISVINASYPPYNNYIWPTPQFSINDGQAVSLTVTGLVATARFRGHVTDDFGTPLSDLEAAADVAGYYGAFTYAITDDNGYFDMPVFGGHWDFIFLDNLPGLVFPDLPPFTITDGVNLTNNIIARTVTGTVSGYVHDTGGHGIANLAVAVTNHVGLTNFTLQTRTDTNGNYSVAVFNGSWNVRLNSTLDNLGYLEVAPTNVSLPPAGAVANFTLTSVPPPQILTTSLFDATINSYYQANLELTNGSYPTFWYLTSGTLPGGLSLNIFGYISGTPTNLGLSNFTLKVQDSRGSNDVRTLSIQVDPAPIIPLQILTTYLASPVVGCSYANQLQATNGTPPYSWSLASGSNPLPPGLRLATNGIISGTPTIDGYYPVVVQVTGADNSTTNGMVQIQVSSALQIYPHDLSAGSVGAYYYDYLYFSGGAQPQTWSVISGSLPPGLALDPAYGYITGTPSMPATNTFTLRVTDGCATIDTLVSITNYSATKILTTYLANMAVGCFYTNQFLATNGTPPYLWALADGSNPLPPGLQFATNGIISGTPTADGYFTILIQVTGADSATTNGAVQIQVNPALQVNPHDLSAGEAGASYFDGIYASGGTQPQIWSVISGSLPPGLALDPASGYISGMPTMPATNTFTLRVTDGCATIDTPASITNYPALQITTSTLPAASMNVPYNAQLQAAGGVPPYYWYNFSALPDGLTLNSDGSITGTPTSESPNEFTCAVYDALGISATTNLTMGAVSRPVLDLPAMSGANRFTFRVTGVSGQGYTVQSTLDLSNWADLFTTNAPANVFYLTDTNAPGPDRFYRLKESP